MDQFHATPENKTAYHTRGITDVLDVRLTVRRWERKGELIRDKKRDDKFRKSERQLQSYAAKTIDKYCVNNIRIKIYVW